MVVYGAVPNLGGAVDQAVALAEQQSAENPAFNQWWTSGAGQELKKLIGGIQTVTPLLGDEIVYGVCAAGSASGQSFRSCWPKCGRENAPNWMPPKQPGDRHANAPEYRLSDTVLAASNSAVEPAVGAGVIWAQGAGYVFRHGDCVAIPGWRRVAAGHRHGICPFDERSRRKPVWSASAGEASLRSSNEVPGRRRE